MTPKNLKDILKDAHAHFFLLKEGDAMRLKLYDILDDALVVEQPVGAPMRRTVLGYIPTLDGAGIYELEGKVEVDPLPEQMPNTIRIVVDPLLVHRVNRRLYPRFHFAPPIDASVVARGEEKRTPAQVINLSAGGLRLESKEKLSPKKTYAFHFEIEQGDEIHALSPEGRIAYEIPLKNGFAYGVKFGTPEEKKAGGDEAPVEALDRTVDLMGLVNRLFVREGE